MAMLPPCIACRGGAPGAAWHASTRCQRHPYGARARARRYYLSGNDAYRLKLQLPLTERYYERLKRERDALMGVPEGMGELSVAAAAAHEGEIA